MLPVANFLEASEVVVNEFSFRVDLYHHYELNTEQAAALGRIEAKLDLINRKENIQMASVQEIQAKLQQVQDDVTAQTTVTQSVSTAISGLQTIIADLRAQLAQAIQANDPVAMQAVLDGMSTVETQLQANNAALSAAASVNTPAAGQP